MIPFYDHDAVHAALAYPRLIEFVTELPKTPSGKIQRFLLRNQEINKQQAKTA